MTVSYKIISRRCDESMRRSKERCYISSIGRMAWRCTGECSRCICCIETIEDGTERHVSLRGVKHDSKRILATVLGTHNQSADDSGDN